MKLFNRNGAMKAIALATLTGAVITAAFALPQRSVRTGSVKAGGGTWTAKASLPVGMAEIGVAALDGKIYAIGGTEQDAKAPVKWDSTLNMRYDPQRNVWQKRAPLPHPLSHAGVATLGGKLYAVGGFTTPIHLGPQNLAFVYDPRTNRWSALPPISSRRGSVAAAAVGGKLHIFGGRISNKIVTMPSPPGSPVFRAGFGTVNTHQIYDPATNKWSSGRPIPGPARDHMGVAVLDGKVHLFGGRIADVVDNLSRHDVYDPRTEKWTSAALLPRPRSSGSYTVLDGLIIYAGGECKPGGKPFTRNVYNDVTAYDAKTNTWTTLKPLPHARHAFGAATIGNTAYFVGGAPFCGGGTSTDLLSLRLSQPQAIAQAAMPSTATEDCHCSTTLPREITLREPGLYPEDVEWDSQRKRFLVSSVSRGVVSVVEDDGYLRTLTDGRNIKSAIGIHLDPARNRLLVSGADFSALANPKIKGEAKLAIYNLSSGKRERLVDLASLRPRGRHLSNDVTIDPQGNAYITDSFSPVIYRVTPGGQTSVFLDDPRLESKVLNLNGIAYHHGGFLLVAVGSRHALYRIPIGAPQKLSRVRLPEPIYADSLTLWPDGNLIAAVPFAPGVVEPSSRDGWETARVVGRFATNKAATTTSATLRAGAVYGLNSHFAGMGQKQPVQTFEIFRANLSRGKVQPGQA